MKKIQSFLFCLLFPILLYGKGNLKDTITVYVNELAYELTISLDSTVNESGKKQISAVCVELMKQRKVVGKRIFPLSGRCPIEEEISINGADLGFTITIPYCDGYLFRFGEARFVYSKEQDEFHSDCLQRRNYRQVNPDIDDKVIKYNICAEVPIVLSTFSVAEIRSNHR